MSASYPVDPLSPAVLAGENCRLTASQKTLYLAMIHLADPKTRLVEASTSELARTSGLSRPTVIRARNELLEAWAIEAVEWGRKTAAGGPAPSVYRLIAKHMQVVAR